MPERIKVGLDEWVVALGGTELLTDGLSGCVALVCENMSGGNDGWVDIPASGVVRHIGLAHVYSGCKAANFEAYAEKIGNMLDVMGDPIDEVTLVVGEDEGHDSWLFTKLTGWLKADDRVSRVTHYSDEHRGGGVSIRYSGPIPDIEIKGDLNKARFTGGFISTKTATEMVSYGYLSDSGKPVVM